MADSKEPLLQLRVMRDVLYDLDIEDIKHDLIDSGLFSQMDVADILAETNEDLRLDLLFTILEQKIHKGHIYIVKAFLDVLKAFYHWIVERYDENVRNGKSYLISRYFSYMNNTTVPRIDELYVYRREQIWELYKYLKQLKHGVHGQRYLFVYGGFGTGKWTLVSQACFNFSIVEHMDFHIFYLNLANCEADEQILEQLENLYMQLETNHKFDDITYNGRYPTNEIYLRKRRLIQLLEDRFRNSLLILSHVRKPALIENFDLKCKTLVITSNKDVIYKVNENERFVMKLKLGFTEDESMELFGKALLLKSDHLPREAHEIHRMCRGNPFVIKLIARKMSEHGNTYGTASNKYVVRVWQKLANDLNRYSIAIENTTIQSILDQLSDEEQRAFRSLVIFRDNVKIPPSVLQRYWNLSPEQTETLTTKLINKGLLDKRLGKDQQIFYVLHYVCYSFLLKENPDDPHANLHCQLVESYRISDAFRNRTELDLRKFFPNDDYFHFYIATHLEVSGMHSLFPDLFIDFGFLEQKLRYTGLPNTVGDLRLFQHRIFHRMDNPDLYAEMLTDFLMGAEVLLSKSADACLLQLALNCTGVISDEAKRQANQYTNRVWFCDLDHAHQHQLVTVPSAPRKVRFQDAGSALVSLCNNQISLVDFCPWYSAPATIFDGNKGPVKDMYTINNVLVALDSKGSLNFWSLKNIPQDRNARQHEIDGNTRHTIQSLRSLDPVADPFVHFAIIPSEQPSNDNYMQAADMFVVTKNGFLHFYTGTSNFQQTNRHYTHIKNTYMMKALNESSAKTHKLLFLTEDKHGYIFNLISTSIEYKFEEPQVINIHYTGNKLISVCPNDIQMRTLKRNNRNSPETEQLEVIYKTPRHHQNTCSAISDDFLYIILGTTQGISIFNIQDHIEVLRTNISHNIFDVDVLSLDDDQYRYILISSSEASENVINMYSLMVTANNQLVSNGNQLQGNTHFLANLDHDPVTVRTVDRKRLIQELRFSTVHGDDFCKLTPTNENDPLPSEIQQLISYRSGYYVGLNNGDVLRLRDWSNPKDGTKPETLLQFRGSISLLKFYDELQLLVAASKNICIVVNDGQTVHKISYEICECFLYLDRYLMFIFENCSIQIFNAVSKTIEIYLEYKFIYRASAFINQCLIICTSDGTIKQIGLNLDENGCLEIQELHVYGPSENSPPKWISCCAASTNGELLAVGYKEGGIEVFNAEDRKLIATLESHTCEVASLYFSPWQDPNSPHILVSIGDQIVFWNIDYVINNPRMDSNDFKRRSNRYKSRPPYASPAIDIHKRSSFDRRSSGLSSPLAASPARNGSFTFDINEAELQWLSKAGPSNKPQLLSCIKLIGSAKKLMISRDFTKFFTIDDEGYLYYLRLYQPDQNRLTVSVENTIRERSPNILHT